MEDFKNEVKNKIQNALAGLQRNPKSEDEYEEVGEELEAEEPEGLEDGREQRFLIAMETLHKHPHREEEICDVNAAGIDIEKEPRDENACMKEYKKGKMIFSLWAVSPKRQGGLGFTTSQVGVVLAISGLALFVFQITTFPPLAKLFGPIHVTRTSAIISIPLLTAYPFIALLRDRALWIIINCASSLKYIFCTAVHFFFNLKQCSSSLLQTRDQRAAANGLQMSAMSLFKTIGPAAAGILFCCCWNLIVFKIALLLFSWGQKRQNTDFLPGAHLKFLLFYWKKLVTAY
ncbi:protein ZINC INDUCED FACILITATOR 1-like [Cryptomeria japonica]|uniref:protein ZINC INDUCED FACILITATOR 1-like n=1 Tax=Cryptomeria japonica TaxID=3369 RepID=UPI0027DA4FAE|nr:protein ZINC INDUCED FACILITATOR 1-like [Cryptomeria japonica]